MTVEVAETKIAELWAAALADADIESADTLLFMFPCVESSTGYAGKSWHRGVVVNEKGDVDAFGERLSEANGDDGLAHHRVAVWTRRPPEGLAAALRHELEHIRQFETHDADVLEELHARALDVLSVHAAGIPGGGILYNAIPMEADANAAASRFVRSLFGDAPIDALVRRGHADVAMLRRLGPPLPMATLGTRMDEFVASEGARAAKAFVRDRGAGSHAEHEATSAAVSQDEPRRRDT